MELVVGVGSEVLKTGSGFFREFGVRRGYF